MDAITIKAIVACFSKFHCRHLEFPGLELLTEHISLGLEKSVGGKYGRSKGAAPDFFNQLHLVCFYCLSPFNYYLVHILDTCLG